MDVWGWLYATPVGKPQKTILRNMGLELLTNGSC